MFYRNGGPVRLLLRAVFALLLYRDYESSTFRSGKSPSRLYIFAATFVRWHTGPGLAVSTYHFRENETNRSGAPRRPNGSIRSPEERDWKSAYHFRANDGWPRGRRQVFRSTPQYRGDFHTPRAVLTPMSAFLNALREWNVNARRMEGAVSLVADIDWPPRAITMLDLDGREVHLELTSL